MKNCDFEYDKKIELNVDFSKASSLVDLKALVDDKEERISLVNQVNRWIDTKLHDENETPWFHWAMNEFLEEYESKINDKNYKPSYALMYLYLATVWWKNAKKLQVPAGDRCDGETYLKRLMKARLDKQNTRSDKQNINIIQELNTVENQYLENNDDIIAYKKTINAIELQKEKLEWDLSGLWVTQNTLKVLLDYSPRYKDKIPLITNLDLSDNKTLEDKENWLGQWWTVEYIIWKSFKSLRKLSIDNTGITKIPMTFRLPYLNELQVNNEMIKWMYESRVEKSDMIKIQSDPHFQMLWKTRMDNSIIWWDYKLSKEDISAWFLEKKQHKDEVDGSKIERDEDDAINISWDSIVVNPEWNRSKEFELTDDWSPVKKLFERLKNNKNTVDNSKIQYVWFWPKI